MFNVMREKPKSCWWGFHRLWLWGIGCLAVGAALGSTGLLSRGLHPPPKWKHDSEGPRPVAACCCPIPAQALAGLDIAELNLMCADGLPGANGINISGAKATLDDWTKHVRQETERSLPKFRNRPAEYENSEAYFRILVLVTVLQQDFKIHYNRGQIDSPDFTDSRNLFIHGLLSKERQGTCVSIPVLYVAIGRRLGYPLKLVTTKAHLFARWESADGRERFNIEATNQGLNCFPDDYYRTWPVPVTEAEIENASYLKSLTPAEELALFLSTRGHCLESCGRFAEAQVPHAHAHLLAPGSAVYLAFLASAVKKEMPNWREVEVDLGQTTPLETKKERKL